MEVSNEHGYGSFYDRSLIPALELKSSLSLSEKPHLNIDLNRCLKQQTSLPLMRFQQKTKKPVRYVFS